jgi:very-short-patch-repair endonuclease
MSVARISRVDVAFKPFFRRKFLLSRAEKYFYGVLRRVVAPHSVLAKVRLADLVEADERHLLRQANFNRIKSKHIDFVICDAALCPIIAVELDDSSHQRPDRKARDRDVDQILKIASLPILRVPLRRAYDDDEIERQLLAKIGRGRQG